jgi:hypothetical protein
MNIVSDILENLTDDLREDFEERAAIMEFDGGLDRRLAEALALLCILQNKPCALVALEIQLNGETQYLLTTSLGDAKLRFGDHIIRVLDPVDLIHREFSDLAQLMATDLRS